MISRTTLKSKSTIIALLSASGLLMIYTVVLPWAGYLTAGVLPCGSTQITASATLFFVGAYWFSLPLILEALQQRDNGATLDSAIGFGASLAWYASLLLAALSFNFIILAVVFLATGVCLMLAGDNMRESANNSLKADGPDGPPP